MTEITSVYRGVKITLEIRRFLESMNDIVTSLTSVMEDTEVTIVQIKENRLIPRIRQLYTVLTWLHYYYIRVIFVPCNINTKKKERRYEHKIT